MKAPGFPTQMGEEPGAFRVHAYGEVRAQGRDGTLVWSPLILKDEVGTPFRQPQAHLSPWNEWGIFASAGQDPVNTRQNQPGG